MASQNQKTGAVSLPERVDADIAGVQGEEARSTVTAAPQHDDALPDEDAPVDAGEIEWAGTIVEKSPHSGA